MDLIVSFFVVFKVQEQKPSKSDGAVFVFTTKSQQELSDN